MIRLCIFMLVLGFTPIAQAASNYNAQDYVLATGKFIDPSDNRDDLIAIARSPTGVSGLIEATSGGLGNVHQTWTAEHLGIPWPNGGVLPIVGNFNSPTDGREDIFLQRATPGLHYVSLIDTWYKLTSKDQTFGDNYLGTTWSQQSTRIVSGDFDGNGRADLFLQPRSRGKSSYVATASVDGKFVTALSPTLVPDFGSLKWSVPESLVHAGDFNGDGRSDLLVQAKPVSVPILMPGAIPGSPFPSIVQVDRDVANANGIAWATNPTFGFSATTARWSRKDLGADWSPQRYVVHVGNFDKNVNSNATDDVFLQPRRAGDPAYLVQFAACTAPCGNNRTVRTVQAPTGSSGWEWSTTTGNIIVGDFNGDGTADLYFQALTAAGTSQVVTVNAAGLGPVITGVTTPTEPLLQQGGGVFNPQPGTAVGGTLGQFSVDQSGAAHYNIPIAVPPGVAGMAPQLELAYNSGGANGFIGPGWSLGGFSAISRCPKTFAQDSIPVAGVADGVDLDSNDNWCLDGARLQVLASSTTEFRTHIESFQKVVASAAPGAASISWTVKDKAGLTRTYGAYPGQADGVVAAQGQPTVALTYLVKQIEDGFGNFIHFDYTQDAWTPGSYVPLRVKYGYSTSTAVASVEFQYEARPDVQWGYLAGTKLSNSWRLNRLVTYLGSSRVREYVVAYQYSPSTNRSLLKSVTECERRTNTCLSATTFDWQTGARGFSNPKYVPSVDRYYQQILDVDGNGINDYAFVYYNAPNWSTRFNRPNGVASPSSGGLAEATSTFAARGTHWVTMDADGDGFGDLVQHNPADLHVQTAFGGGPATNAGLKTAYASSGFTLPTAAWATAVGADVNGDGRDDLVYVNPNYDVDKLYVRLATGSSVDPFDGIAKTVDLIGAANPGCSGYDAGTTEAWEVDGAYVRPLQFDSDGVADLLIVRRNRYYCSGVPTDAFALQVYSYDGSTFTLKYSEEGGSTPNEWTYPRIVDANGDGLSDLLHSTGYGWELQVATGDIATTTSGFTNAWYRSGTATIPQCSDTVASNFDAAVSTYDSASACHHGSQGSASINFSSDQLRYSVILDYNHDGRTDILVCESCAYGTHWKALVAMPNSTGVPKYDTLAYDTDAEIDGYTRAFALDVGGDGFADIVSQGDGDSAYSIHHGRGPLPDLINQVNNGLIPQTVQVQYSTTADSGVYLGFENRMDGDGSGGLVAPSFPYSHATAAVPVVKKYLVPDGSGNFITTRYTYQGAKVHRQGYGFAGFAEVNAWNDNAGIGTRNRYMQSFPWTGMIKLAETRAPHASSAVLAQPVANLLLLKYWGLCEGPGGQDQTPMHPNCWYMLPGTEVVLPVQPPFITQQTVNTYGEKQGTASVSTFPFLLQSDEKAYALSNATPAPTQQPAVLKITKAEYKSGAGTSYDSYGNVGRILVTVTDGSGTNVHTTETVNTYVDNIAAWRLGRLTSTTVTQTRQFYSDNVTSVSAGRVSTFGYDPSSGLLTSETLEPGTSLRSTKTYGYDSRGNRTSETQSGATNAGYAVVDRVTTADYNGSGNQLPFPSKTTNAEGHQETYTWDARFGVKTSLTGPNGLTTSWSYDGFGRPTGEVAALSNVVTDTSYESCNSGYACATGSKYKVITTSSAGARSVVEYDGLMREVFRTGTAATGTDLLQQRAYDPLGREFRVTLPYRSGNNPCWTLRKFDFQNRVVKEWSPGSSNSLTSNCIISTPPAFDASLPGGGHLKQMTYDELYEFGIILTTSNDAGRIVVRHTNVMDRLIQLTEGSISTVYDYDAFGNNTYVRDPENNITRIAYNARGFKTSMSDPNMGVINGSNQGGWQYIYNAFGELVEQTDARDIKICQIYDRLGRMTQRVDGCNYAVGASSRFVTNWTYDTAPMGKGQLYQATGPFTTNAANAQQTNPFQETYTYDSLGRPTQVVRLIDGQYFWSNVSFDDQGRLASQTYPASEETAYATSAGGRRHTVLYEYNDRGVLSRVKSAAGLAYWTLGNTDALGNTTSFTLANGAVQTRTYDPATGYLLENQASVGNNVLQLEDYDWSLRGNLTQRRDNKMVSGNWLTEDLEYDPYDRLTVVKVTAPAINGGAQVTYTNTYSNSGKLMTKGASNGGGYTSYAYGTGNSYSAGDAGSHAVTSVVANGATRTYTYDNNGNMLGGDGRAMSWTAANLPETIIKGSDWSTFSYGPDRARYRQFTASPCTGCPCTQPTSTTLYVGDSFERITTNQNSTAQYRHYIRAGSLTIAIHTEYSTGTGTSDNYLHHDHLGSVVAMTNSAGAMVERFSYDPWGKRRNVGASTAWSSLAPGNYLSPLTLAIQTRGFTNHEHLDKLGLIHMNGRVYDPELGRFISADSVIQFPESTQGLDRYAYVNNNPLSYTDPSGHWIWFVVAAIVSAGYGEAVLVAMVIAGIAGYLETGTLRGALFSALSAGIASGIGSYFGNIGSFGNELGRALAHGLTQGALAAAQGGKFGAAALAGAFSSGAGSAMGRFGPKGTGTGSRIARVAAAATVGGTASRIGGGKFGNGAVTGAFVQAFNHEAHSAKDPAELELSDDGLDAIKQHEGYSSTIYKDAAGYDTIGYGHKLVAGEAETFRNGITEEQATHLLTSDVASAQNAVRSAVTVPVNQYEFDALVSFTYNLGSSALSSSTLLRNLNAGGYGRAQAQFQRWNKITVNGAKVPSQGLTNRRADEACMFSGAPC